VSHALTTGSAPAPLPLLAAVAAVCVVAVLARPVTRLGTMLATGGSLVAGHTVLASLGGVLGGIAGQGCLPAVGRGARVGLWLAMLQPDGSCPVGTYAAGPMSLLAPVILAVVIVAGHAAVAVTAGVTAGLASAAGRMRRLAARVRRALSLLTCPAQVVVTGTGAVRGPGAVRPPRQVLWRASVVRRGPPALGPA